jgi:protein phosphatase
MGQPIEITAAGITDVGQVRSANQDSFLIDEAERLFIVADGMGGHAGGEIASSLCVQEVAKHLKENAEAFTPKDDRQHPDPRISNLLAHAINHASTKIYERALEDPSLRGMGTTATVLKLVDGQAYVAHVGDSRCYLLRCGFIYQVTNDHSLVSEQVRAGILTKEEAEAHHLRNVITRSVGYQEEEDVDTTSLPMEDGDLLVMCSDGLHGKVADKEISLITKDLGVQAAARLVALANERGGDDNISVVVVKVKVPTP